MVLTAYSALSSATNSSCHRRLRIKVCPSPVGPTRLRKLDISNGCQDHTVLPSAIAPLVCALCFAHGKPALQNATCSTLSRPPHPAPNVRDDRDTPLSWDGITRSKSLIWGSRQALDLDSSDDKMRH